MDEFSRAALCRQGQPVRRLHADHGADHRAFKPGIAIAQESPHSLRIQPAGDLLRAGDGERVAGHLGQAAAPEFVLQRRQLSLRRLADRVGAAQRIGKLGVAHVVESGKVVGSHRRSPGTLLVRAASVLVTPLRPAPLSRYKISMSTLDSAKKSRMGRPPVESEAVNVRLLRDALVRLDNWRRHQPDIPGRPEAIRRLIEIGLKAAREEPPKELR